MMKIYGDEISGNCLKVKYTADFLGLAYQWVPVDVIKGETRTPEFLSMSRMGQVPLVELGNDLLDYLLRVLVIINGKGGVITKMVNFPAQDASAKGMKG